MGICSIATCPQREHVERSPQGDVHRFFAAFRLISVSTYNKRLIAKQLSRRGRDGGLLGDLRGPLGTISKHPEPLAVDARGGDAEHPGCLSDGQPGDLLKVALADPLPFPSELLTLPPCAGETGVDALPNPLPLELGERSMMPRSSLPVGLAVSMFSPVLTNDTPAAFRSSIAVIRVRRLRPKRSNRHTTTVSTVRRRASVMSWSSAGRRSFAPLTPVSSFGRLPSARRAVAAKIDQLILAGLVGRAHARVDGCPHARLPVRLALVAAPLMASTSTPFSFSHAATARRICSLCGTPSRSRTASSPAFNSGGSSSDVM